MTTYGLVELAVRSDGSVTRHQVSRDWSLESVQDQIAQAKAGKLSRPWDVLSEGPTLYALATTDPIWLGYLQQDGTEAPPLFSVLLWAALP